MLTVAVIDDERPALEEMCEYLQACEGIETIKAYYNPVMALEEIKLWKPDVVFLDIHMPGMTGLVFAEKLLEYSPQTETVFVTAHNDYTWEAFELSATGYLLKPIKPERLQVVIKRLLEHKQENQSKAAETTHSIVVQCFGAFQVLGPLGPVKWRTSKAEEVFSYLWLQQECHVDNIISDIFPDHDSLKVKQYLHTCIYLIRKSLKQAGIDDALVISFERDRYRITYTDVQCDSQQFLELAQAIQLKPDVKLLTGALALYTEGLMVNLESFWIYKHREKFYQLYLQLMEQLVTLLLSRQDGRQALEYAKQLVHLEPLDENYTLLLIESYQGLGKWAKAEETFEQFSQKLHHELGEQVSTRFLEQYHYLEKRR